MRLDAVIGAVVGRAAADLRAALWPTLTGSGDAAARLTASLHVLCTVVETHRGVLAALFHAPEKPHRAHAGRTTGFDFIEPFERLLRDGLADGTLVSDDPVADAELTVNAVTWTYLHLRLAHRWPARVPPTAPSRWRPPTSPRAFDSRCAVLTRTTAIKRREAGAAGQDDGLRAIGGVHLGEHVRHVVAHRLRVQHQPAGDGTVVEALGDEGEHLQLTIGELGKGRLAAAVRVRTCTSSLTAWARSAFSTTSPPATVRARARPGRARRPSRGSRGRRSAAR